MPIFCQENIKIYEDKIKSWERENWRIRRLWLRLTEAHTAAAVLIDLFVPHVTCSAWGIDESWNLIWYSDSSSGSARYTILSMYMYLYILTMCVVQLCYAVLACLLVGSDRNLSHNKIIRFGHFRTCQNNAVTLSLLRVWLDYRSSSKVSERPDASIQSYNR